MKDIKVWLREAFYIRKDSLDLETQNLLRKQFSFYFFEEKACEQCEEKIFRRNEKTGKVCERCQECAAFLGGAELSKSLVIGKHKYLSVPSGSGRILAKILKQKYHPILKSLAKNNPIKPIEFSGKLRDYQEEACQAIYKKKRGVICLPPRSGKCVASGTMVMTAQGFLPIEKLFEGYTLNHKKESVFSTNIKVATYQGTRKVSHLYSKLVDRTILVKTENGYTLQGTPNHPVMVLTDDFDFAWKPLGKLTKSDILVMSRRTQWLPKGTPVFDLLPTYKTSKGDSSITQIMPKKMSEELAELLGFWVANGCLSVNLSVSSHSKEIRQRFAECFSKVFPKATLRTTMKESKEVGIDVSMGSKQIYKFLEETIGLSMSTAKDKAIPEVLLKGDKKYLTAFLRAYISCDAYVTPTAIELCSASQKLIHQLQEILPYYGVRSHLKTSKSCATNGSGIYRDYYHLFIRNAQAQILIKELGSLYKEYYIKEDILNETDVYYRAGDFLNNLHKKYKKEKTYYSLSDGRKVYIYDRPLHPRFLKKGSFKLSYCVAAGLRNVDEDLLKEMDREAYNKWVKVTKNPDIFYNKIDSIEVINTPTRVYDICVPKNHHFIANTFVSHNTLIGVAAICRIQQKTMILASQREWLLGFQETFLGSATQEGFTKLDKERIGFCKTYEDFKKYDICLVTVQSLHSERGQVLLKKIRSMFGCVVIDEVHGGAAPKYIQVLSQINCKYKIGLSGTPDRKDGKYVLVEHVVGPVIFETKVKQLVPQVLLTRTNFSKASSSTGIWAYIVGPLEKDKNRQKLIAKIALEDIKKGHMILIPYSGVKAILTQVEIINKMAGKEVAKAFYGSVKKKERDKIIEDARNYKLAIIVGNIKLLSTGINIPRASEIIDSSIQANIPNARQRFARILTPWEDKPQPVIRLLLDDYNVKRSCLRMEFWQALMPYFHPKISEIDYNILKKYFSNKKDFEITLGRYD